MSDPIDNYLSLNSPWSYLGHQRLAELARWRDYLDLELNVHPAHWPVDERAAAGMVLAAREAGGHDHHHHEGQCPVCHVV